MVPRRCPRGVIVRTKPFKKRRAGDRAMNYYQSFPIRARQTGGPSKVVVILVEIGSLEAVELAPIWWQRGIELDTMKGPPFQHGGKQLQSQKHRGSGRHHNQPASGGLEVRSGSAERLLDLFLWRRRLRILREFPLAVVRMR